MVVANFTTETTPAYSDPEDDALSLIKILTLPSVGTLKLNGIDVIVGQQITSGQISTNNFTYVSTIDGDYTFTFDAADVGSNSLSGLSTGIITMSVAEKINLPPSVVGDNAFNLSYGDSLIFTTANFTSGTTPAYVDPEGDPPQSVKILSLPANGDLVHNGINVIVNQVIPVSEINSGYLIYEPDLSETALQNLSFNFSVADTGSGIHTE